VINEAIKCDHACCDTERPVTLPKLDFDPEKIRMIMISEAPPADRSNYFYQNSTGSFFKTTQAAFADAGFKINDYDDITKMGIFLTTAIKCEKKDYLVSARTIKKCSGVLEKELAQFPNLRLIMCMGDFAIKAVNHIYKNKYKVAPIKAGSTYKIRAEEHTLNETRFFPSYTQTGDSFNIEKSKRRMIAEDIKKALEYLGFHG